ncbi:hypothetical protein EON62_00805 [archaeon]|nr:MAG: hypothetical protein EON62_00805 [archaeon]
MAAHRDEATGGVRLWISDYTSHTVRHVDAAGTISTIAGTPNLPGTIGDGDAAQNAQLHNPAGIAILFNAVTGGFRVWIAELEGHRVRHVSEGGIITTVAGTGSSSHSGDGGFAINAGVVRPSDIAVTRSIIDGQPVLWIVEAGTGVVRCVTTDGRISTAAGNPTVSTFGDGGPPQAANMRGITGIAVLEDATTGNVTMWLADNSNHRIRRVVVGYVVDTLVGGLEGGGPATYARLAVPSDVAVLVNDTTGGASLWIADRDNNCIRHVSEAGIITRVAGGVGIGGYVIDGARAVDTLISEPRSIAVRRNASTGGVAMWIVAHGDGRVCYVSEAGLIYTVAGSGISTNLGDGWPATSAYLAQPSSVDVVRNETDGRVALWITTLADHRVRAVNSSGIIGTVVGDSAADLPAREARLSSPTGLAVYINATTGSVQFWIAERSGNRIRHVSTAGIMSTTAGTGTAGAAGNGGLAVRAQLSAPFAVAFTRNAMTGEFTVWFTESANGLVRRVTPDGIISIVAGGGVPGIRGDDGPAVSAYLSSPRGLGVLSVPDADGLLNTSMLFIAESLPSKRIRRAVVGDAITTYAGGDTDGAPAAAVRMDTPADVHASLNATTQSADVWIVDSVQHVLRRLSPEGILFTVAGTGDVGFAGDGGPAKAAQLNAPVAVSVLFNESLGTHIAWVADSQNSRVRMVVAGGNISTAVGGGTDLEDDGSKVGTSFALARPVAVASVAGSSGGVLLWIVDADLQTVYHVNEDGFIARIAGQYLLGGTTGDGGPALQAQLKNPADVAVLYSATTGARRVWIADTGNLRVRYIAEDGTISTVAGGGSAVGTGNGGPATAARLTNPTCVTVSLDAATGDPVLWISESSANRVRRVTTSDGIISTFAGAGTVTTPLRGDGGQAYYAFVYRPQGVAVVRNAMTGVDMVWIAETGGARIRFVQENNATPTPSVTASTSPSMSRTPSTTRTPSATASISVSATPSTTVSLTPSATTSSSVSATPSATATTSPSSSATPSASMVRASPPPNRGVVSYIIRV